VQQLLLVPYSVVLQELSFLKEDLANTQQWEEDKTNPHFSLILFSVLSEY
jgi:hypothetical protein